MILPSAFPSAVFVCNLHRMQWRSLEYFPEVNKNFANIFASQNARVDSFGLDATPHRIEYYSLQGLLYDLKPLVVVAV
jgi:hypothetical protein